MGVPTPRTAEGLGKDVDQRITLLERRLGVLPDRIRSAGMKVDDWNDAIQTGFYWSDAGAANSAIPGDAMALVLLGEGGMIMQEMWSPSAPAGTWRRTYTGTSWTAWAASSGESGPAGPATETTAGIAQLATYTEAILTPGSNFQSTIATPQRVKDYVDLFAPTVGFGRTSEFVEDWDDILAVGFYKGYNSTLNNPPGIPSSVYLGIVHSSETYGYQGQGGGPIIQELFEMVFDENVGEFGDYTARDFKWIRYGFSGDWQGWISTEASMDRRGVARFTTQSELDDGALERTIATPLDVIYLARGERMMASTTARGTLELATNLEVQVGTDTFRAVTPAGLKSLTALTGRRGLAEIATTEEVIQGSDATRIVTPRGLRDRLALPDPQHAVYAGEIEVTATGWTPLPSLGTIDVILDRPAWCQLSLGAWVVSAAGETRAGVALGGATSMTPTEATPDDPTSALGQVLLKQSGPGTVEWRRNLTLNPSATVDAAYMTTYQTGGNQEVARSTEQSVSGPASFKFTCLSATTRFGPQVLLDNGVDPLVSYEAGDPLPVSFDIYIPADSFPSFTGTITYVTSTPSGASSAGSYFLNLLPDAWYRVERVLAVPDSGELNRMFWSINGDYTGGEELYIDNILIGEEGPFFDGSTSPIPSLTPSWVGVPDASPSILTGSGASQLLLSKTVKLNAGTTTVSAEAYQQGGSVHQVNHPMLQVTPMRSA